MRKKTPEGVVLAMKAMWAQMYSLPTNDERLCSLTLRELSEEIALRTAITEYGAERRRETRVEMVVDPYEQAAGGVEDRSPEAAELADTPVLTGDPEFDRLEMEQVAEELPGG